VGKLNPQSAIEDVERWRYARHATRLMSLWVSLRALPGTLAPSLPQCTQTISKGGYGIVKLG
jgi:hypothetical protein